MKKYFVLLLFVTSGLQTISSQNDHNSCLRFDKNRTGKEFKKTILSGIDPVTRKKDMFIQTQMWPAYAGIINMYLENSEIPKIKNNPITPDKKGMKKFLRHAVIVGTYFGTTNTGGVRTGDELVFLGNINDSGETLFVAIRYGDIFEIVAALASGNPDNPQNPNQILSETRAREMSKFHIRAADIALVILIYGVPFVISAL